MFALHALHIEIDSVVKYHWYSNAIRMICVITLAGKTSFYCQLASAACISQKVYMKEVVSGHYLPQFTWTVDQKWNWVKLEFVQTLLRITRLTHKKSYLLIICPNSHEKLTKTEIMWLLFAPIWFYLPLLGPQSQPRWLSGLRCSLVHSLMIVHHCFLRNWDRILVRAV